MAKEDFRTGVEWDDTPSDELDPLVCSDIRYEGDGMTHSCVDRSCAISELNCLWGRLRTAANMPAWAERNNLIELPTKERSNAE